MGDPKRAVALLEAALETDELKDSLYANLIALRAERGASAESDDSWNAAPHTLRTRLGVDPSPDMSVSA